MVFFLKKKQPHSPDTVEAEIMILSEKRPAVSETSLWNGGENHVGLSHHHYNLIVKPGGQSQLTSSSFVTEQ